jgi:hypothetical protein
MDTHRAAGQGYLVVSIVQIERVHKLNRLIQHSLVHAGQQQDILPRRIIEYGYQPTWWRRWKSPLLFTGFCHPKVLRHTVLAEQIFDCETVVKIFRSFAVEYGDVNPDVYRLPANCDGSLLSLPCCTANGFCAMPQVPNPPDDPQKACLPLRIMLLASPGTQALMRVPPEFAPL